MTDSASHGNGNRPGALACARKPPRPSWRGRRGQSLVEYMFATLALLFLFSSMYGFTQGQLKKLFTAASRVMLRAYH